MINSRNLSDLHPIVYDLCQQLLARCDYENIDLLVTSTYRDNESQAALYAHGRTIPGRILTNAPPGKSFHNWRVAFDVVPLRNGKPVWGTSGNDLILWRRVGNIGKKLGLDWAGDWKTFKEFPHFQFTQNLSCFDFANGKTLS